MQMSVSLFSIKLSSVVASAYRALTFPLLFEIIYNSERTILNGG